MKKHLLVLSFVLFYLAGFSQQNPYSVEPYNPSNPYAADGGFLRNNSTMQIYIVMEGKLRYIQTPATLNGLFIDAAENVVDFPPLILGTYPVGTAVSQASGFIRYVPTGQVYLREGTYLRWITTIQVAQIYHFNFSIAVNVNSLAGYTIGPNLTE